MFIPVSSAKADTVIYTSDQCSVTVNCFALWYRSISNYGFFYTSCFITNKDEYSHTGRGYVQGTEVVTLRYQFAYASSNRYETPSGDACAADDGAGQAVKNNAAGVSNWDTRPHRVYYNTGYQGTYQTFGASSGRSNLMPALKNENASSARL